MGDRVFRIVLSLYSIAMILSHSMPQRGGFVNAFRLIRLHT